MKMKNEQDTISLKKINSSLSLTREGLLSNIPNNTFNLCWEALGNCVFRNYQNGKATIISKFGSFTFTHPVINLEGSTNQFERDKKPINPIFIVSNEFCENIRPGIYSEKGVSVYQDKSNNLVPHLKLNYAEIALSINMDRNEFQTVIEHILAFLRESIHKKILKNKEIPYIGVLTLKNDILAVKFKETLFDNVKYIPQQNRQARKDAKSIPDLKNNAIPLIYTREKNIINKEFSHSFPKKVHNNLAKSVAISRLNTVSLYPNLIMGEKPQKENSFFPEKFLSESVSEKPIERIEDLGIETSVLKSIYFHKNYLLKELKLRDVGNKRLLGSHDIFLVFLKANLDGLSQNHIKNLLHLYNPTSFQIDYSKFMEKLVTDINNLIKEKTYTNQEVRRLSKSSCQITIHGDKIETNVDFNEVKNEIKTIKSISNKIMNKFLTKVEQNITYIELISILREFDVVFPQEKIIKVLKYIELNPDSFKLKSFISNIESEIYFKEGLKIVCNDITSEDISNTKTKIRNILYASEKTPDELFNIYSTNNIINLKHFKEMVNTFSKDNFLNEFIIETLFLQLTNISKTMNLEQFKNEFFKLNNDLFESKAVQKIIDKIRQKNLTIDEYFDVFISYKNQGLINGTLTKSDFHKALQIENFNYTLQEISVLFQFFDMKKDDVIDRDEWNSRLKTPSDPVFRIQDIIKKNCLDIEEIFYRMEIDLNKNDSFDFNSFKLKIRSLDSSLENSYIQALFNKMKNSKETVDKKTIESYFNVYTRENFRDINGYSFKSNFISHIKQVSSLVHLQGMLEKCDRLGNGLIDKIDFCKSIQSVTKDYKDEEIMKFIRITDLFKGHQKVRYPEFLEIIFYDDQVNTFNSILSVLKKQFYNTNYNLTKLVREITGKVDVNKNFIEFTEMHNYLKLFIKDLNRNIICKLDVDQDGKISILDLKTLLEKFTKTNYFKYENNDENLEVNLFGADKLDEKTFKNLVKSIKNALKQKNITVTGLFNKLDTNGDGMITITEFNQNLDNYIEIAPHIKDMFFNYLDQRKMGMLDYNTFKVIFKEYSSEEKIVSNDWETENRIINEFKNWIRNNKHLNEIEIYYIINSKQQDKIVKEDFTQFILKNLLFSKTEINDFKVERAMTLISMSKNKFLNINDLRHFVGKVRSSFTDTNFFKTSVVFTKSEIENKDKWINEALQKLGYYITDVFKDLDTFFEKYSDSETMNLERFKEFLAEHYNCFEGFNLSDDEIFIVFSTIDPHKKGNITLNDLKSKIEKYNFYEKMHSEIKSYLTSYFKNHNDAFTYFTNQVYENKPIQLDEAKVMLSVKEFFDGINNLFIKKYTTNQVLNYIKLKFRNPECIEYSEFSYIYYDVIVTNPSFIKKTNQLSKSATNFRKRGNSMNSTPFDKDPFDKLRRILKSSKYDSKEYFKIYQMLNDGKLNNNEFINMIKRLNLGFTLLEINHILARLEKTKDGCVIIKDFLKYLDFEDPNQRQANNNIKSTLSYIKQLIVKFYTQPIVCFQFNDPNSQGIIDFEMFKNLVNELYVKENTQPQPSHLTLKSLFDYIDIRKDGKIDQNEWLKTFALTEVPSEKKLGSKKEKIAKEIRLWENSKDISYLFNIFAKNRKFIRDNCKLYSMSPDVIKADNFIKVLKDLFPQIKLSNTQWKILVSLGDKSTREEVRLDVFFDVMNNSSKQNLSHMKIY